MKTPLALLISTTFLCAAVPMLGQVRVLSNAEPQRVFGGAAQAISLTLQNSGTRTETIDGRLKLYQITSATAAPVLEYPWKKLTLPAHQTVLETALIEFPAVRAETRFLVQWLDGASRVLGATEVRAYQADILKSLRTLAGSSPIGVFDPQDQIRPFLAAVDVEIADLEVTGLEHFLGRLAIIGPAGRTERGSGPLPEQIRALAKRKVAVIWIWPASPDRAKLRPSIYMIPGERASVLVVETEVLAHFSTDPRAQLRLVQLAQMALGAAPFPAPSFDPTLANQTQP